MIPVGVDFDILTCGKKREEKHLQDPAKPLDVKYYYNNGMAL